MKRTLVGATALGVALAGSLAASPAEAAGVSVTSPQCNHIRISNQTSSTKVFSFEAGVVKTVGARQSVLYKDAPTGSYAWRQGSSASKLVAGAGRVTVKGCKSTSAKRIVDGDQNKDGRADVLGILTNGNLMYYRSTATGVAAGVKAGSGFGNHVFVQHLNNVLGDGSGNVLIGVKSDGKVVMRQAYGNGRYGAEGVVGSVKGYSQFTVTTQDNPLSWGRHMLLAKKGSNLYGFNITRTGRLTGPYLISTTWAPFVKTIATHDTNGDNMGEILAISSGGVMYRFKVSDAHTAKSKLGASQIISKGWQSSVSVVSPGSLNGDLYGDVVARRSNGDLVRYTFTPRGVSSKKIAGGWGVVKRLG